MNNVVISQSMYFPWVGILEQVRIADVFVHYDDVQYSKGGFLNRVQIKTAHGTKWLTIPLRDLSLGQRIDEVLIDNRVNWKAHHRELLRQAYLHAPFCEDMLCIFDQAMSDNHEILSDVSRSSMNALIKYYSLHEGRKFIDVTELNIGDINSKRVLDVTKAVGGTVYITGHGARNYLQHEIFEEQGIKVRYMKYRCTPYPQKHGNFNPYVSALDLIANCGKQGLSVIQSEAINWKEFINGSN